jgi:hypothetical protein
MAARRSILTSARPVAPISGNPQQPDTPQHSQTSTAGVSASATIRPSRLAKLHLGGYFDARDPTVMAFQKLRVELRRSQQEMLMEAMADFVAKHQASDAFRE